jgi:hypothetical protein
MCGDIGDDIVGGIEDAGNAAANAAGDVANAVGGAITDGANAVAGAVTDGANAAAGAASDAASAVSGFVDGAVKAVGGAISDAGHFVAEGFNKVAEGFIEDAKERVEHAIDGVVGKSEDPSEAQQDFQKDKGNDAIDSGASAQSHSGSGSLAPADHSHGPTAATLADVNAPVSHIPDLERGGGTPHHHGGGHADPAASGGEAAGPVVAHGLGGLFETVAGHVTGTHVAEAFAGLDVPHGHDGIGLSAVGSDHLAALGLPEDSATIHIDHGTPLAGVAHDAFGLAPHHGIHG